VIVPDRLREQLDPAVDEYRILGRRPLQPRAPALCREHAVAGRGVGQDGVGECLGSVGKTAGRTADGVAAEPRDKEQRAGQQRDREDPDPERLTRTRNGR
jgi:hypothetical protein